MKNKVEAQPRKVNKKNRVVKPICDVKHSLLNANSDPNCATCKKSMSDSVHDMCLLDFVKNVNSRAKTAKKHKKQNIWKPTGHDHSANVVPPKKTTSHSVETQKPELKFYSRKPKNVKNVGSSKKAKIVESKNSNHSEPNHTLGSNATDIPSSSSLVITGGPDCSLAQLDSGTTILQGLWGMVTISWEMLLFQEYTTMMSSPNHSTSDIKDAFSSMNILNYTSVSSDYFPASSGSISFNSSENSNIIPSVISPFYNNPCLKDVQAFYAKELPIPSPDPITPPAILTPSPVLPPSLLFDPRYFFVPEELLPPKKQIHSPSSSSTTLSNSSRNQTCDLVSPSFSVYTPTPPQIFEIGKSSSKIHLKHHENQIEDILNYLEELSFLRIGKMEEDNKLKTELEKVRSQIIKLQRKQLGQRDKIAFAHYRISNLEQSIEENQARHQTDQEDL
ncbi:hypothetical protein Tco_1310020 [Tanacetum coccineum]